MYWIYLIIFVLAVLAPDIIPSEKTLFLLRKEQLEELLIFFLGLIGFIIFRWKEKQSSINLKEKIKIQKESSLIFRNLNDTYSYIGEINRKLDMMKAVSINLLEIPCLDPKKEKKVFEPLMESVYILGKSRKFIIRFVNTKNKETEYEIKSKRRMFIKVSNEDIVKNLFNKGQSFTEDDRLFIIASSKKIEEIISAIIIMKNNKQQKLEDPEMLKSLAAHYLFLYYCLRKKKI
ncbi:MAG: hypothetical protein Q7S18_03875 [bacterium]|nr:hypothetical protein [bacterium]